MDLIKEKKSRQIERIIIVSLMSVVEFARLTATTVRSGQEHLLSNIDSLDANGVDEFFAQLNQVDFSLMNDLHRSYIVDKTTVNEFKEEEVSVIENVLSKED